MGKESARLAVENVCVYVRVCVCILTLIKSVQVFARVLGGDKGEGREEGEER